MVRSLNYKYTLNFRAANFQVVLSNSTWSNKPYPIIHGSYITDYFGDNLPYDYDSWKVVNPSVLSMKIFSDGNLMML